MQQIINSQDRSQAFFKFLLFFIITVALVVTAVYFNFRVPVKDNEWLQSQLEIQRIQDANQTKFVSKMEEARVLLDSLDKKDTNKDLVTNMLNKTIGDLQELEQNENTLYGKMNKTIVTKFDELKTEKMERQKLNASVAQLPALQSELNEYKDKYEKANRDLDNYRRPVQ